MSYWAFLVDTMLYYYILLTCLINLGKLGKAGKSPIQSSPMDEDVTCCCCPVKIQIDPSSKMS